MEKTTKWLKGQRGKKAVEALNKNGFESKYISDGKTACAEILNLIPKDAKVGVGGSMTMRQIGVMDTLEKKGNVIYDHWKPGLSPEDVLKIRRAHLTCDVFLTSANAVTMEGMLVSTDGAGNRVGAMMFGPGKVIVVAGVNKVVNDLHSAFRRIKEVATPQVVKDMGLEIPCAVTGFCSDCNSPMRACRATVILERKPFFSDIHVLIVGEDLGF
ncbi:MAG: lactate utilization protein C [Deltaproteobacteria bacterium CG12_big_fil_rev_8_21_14_0_65_43_10]|nr:MAG: lactate utilization protein C [Deltaproteobacteria bacterium CG12_big_fil_rev_8_21_14_0_65_43_10]PIU84802.1 MAG: lactate utilization protein C [Deltaproteobacteria bacterium CG06_land_8_20_14_3_00_44_19]PIX24286.1 MAG: lactate utilization protein C [Deltaproteobacteria bacterium CG_4_8_14_3_um_filter_43_13]PIZ20565.1 MAG: lactate utilization protein C [Deltaproteobacteria bacterium CG_4_10_14_0_8_um_filter_43_12]PJB44964.1 MAG: lactate utilization protein C [Deltaproteobacteria bacteriu